MPRRTKETSTNRRTAATRQEDDRAHRAQPTARRGGGQRNGPAPAPTTAREQHGLTEADGHNERQHRTPDLVAQMLQRLPDLRP
ncbi:hypothetical protein [Streptomyces sp. NPDC002067]